MTLPTKTVEAARWVRECLPLKAGIASHTNQPQILLLSGSNSLMGLSSSYIETHYGIASTNLGVHAGLGRKYILSYGVRLAKRGDLVVLPLEYELYEKERYNNALTLQALVGDISYFHSLPLDEQARLIANMPLSEWFAFVKNRIVPDVAQKGGCQTETNSRGDDIVNQKALVTRDMLQRLERMKPKKYVFEEQAVYDLIELKRALMAKGARVVLAYPNMLANVFDEKLNAAFLDKIKQLSQRTGIPIIGRPDERVFGLQDAFDTEYHENNEGQIKSSEILMKQLLAAHIPLPERIQ